MNAFNDTGLGEPEQDANSALIELDKGLYVHIYNLKKKFCPHLCINKRVELIFHLHRERITMFFIFFFFFCRFTIQQNRRTMRSDSSVSSII